jgi:hypothetical protein
VRWDRIGCRSPGVNHFMGVIDELRIYSRAPAASEIVDLTR